MTTVRDLSLSALLARVVNDKAAKLRVAMPARVTSFDEGKLTCDVQPLQPDIVTGEDGEPFVEPLPVIPDVPVWFVGAGQYAVTHPIAVGDQCLLVFCDRTLDTWAQTGRATVSKDPRAHDLTDAVALFGLVAPGVGRPEYDAGALQIGKQGAPRARFDGAAVHVGVDAGAPGTQDAVRGTSYRAAEDAFFQGLITKLTAASAGASVLSGALTSLAAACTAPPLTPLGALFTSAAGGATTLASQLGSVTADLATFSAQSPTYLTNRVKLP
jgi:Phage protein Gp138 N-terminal domain